MSELVSAYPTAGGIYWWASKLGGASWGWFTGWFNLIGLIAVTASVDYGASLFLNTTLGLYEVGWFNGTSANATTFLHGTFFLFVIVLAAHALINIAGSHFVARSTAYRCGGTSPACWRSCSCSSFVPGHHQSLKFVFTKRFNNSGFGFPHVLVLHPAARLPADAVHDHRLRLLCAHLRGDARRIDDSAKGVWRSIFYSAIFGWVLLLALTFAATHVSEINASGRRPYVSIAILNTALSIAWVKFVLIISTVGQLFCGAACLTSASRMCYAFSRDGAIPGRILGAA